MSDSQGNFVWYELDTSDVQGAIKFYKDVIGWGTQRFGESYVMWTAGETPVGGVMMLPDEAKKMGAPPHWIAYVAADDVDALTKKAESLGAKTHVPPQDIPKVGRFSVIADPQGAVIALLKGSGPAGGGVSLLLAALRLAEDRRRPVPNGDLPDVRQGRPHLGRHGNEAQGLPGAAALALLRQGRRPRRRARAREEGRRPGDARPDGGTRRRPRRAMHRPAAGGLRAPREVGESAKSRRPCAGAGPTRAPAHGASDPSRTVALVVITRQGLRGGGRRPLVKVLRGRA